MGRKKKNGMAWDTMELPLLDFFGSRVMRSVYQCIFGLAGWLLGTLNPILHGCCFFPIIVTFTFIIAIQPSNFCCVYIFFFSLSCVINHRTPAFSNSNSDAKFSAKLLLLQIPFCKLASNSHIITVFLFFILGFVFVFLHFQFKLVMFNSCSSQVLALKYK